MSFLVDFANLLIDGLVLTINLLVAVFPDSPFRSAIDGIKGSIGSELLGYINYFIPISEMFGILSLWLVCIGLYYAVSVIARWVKAIS